MNNNYITTVQATQRKELREAVEKMRDEHCQNSIKYGFVPSGESLNIFFDVLELLQEPKKDAGSSPSVESKFQEIFGAFKKE